MSNKNQFTGNVYEKEYYDKTFQEIENLPNSLSPEEICKVIYDRMNLTMLFVHMSPKSLLESIDLFRLRVPAIGETFDENKISSYYYRPDIENIKTGRANIPKQQVFYASFDGNTPFHELSNQITPNHTICYLSVWCLQNVPEITNVRNFFLGIPPGIEDNLASLMATGLTKSVDLMLSTVSANVRENFLYAQKKYSALFTYPQEYYHLTSAIANDTFVTSQKQGASMPILTYPSVAKNKSSVNIAIRKDYADNHLYLKYVYKVILTELGDDICKIKVEKKGVVKDDIVIWAKPILQYQIKKVFVSEDGKLENMQSLEEGEAFSICCSVHKMNIHQVLETINISEEKIIDALSVNPLDLYSSFPQTFRCFMPIKVAIKLYRSNNISESGLIKYITLAIEFTVTI